MCRKRLRMFVNEYRIEDMENFSFTNTIIESVIGVVGSLVVAYAANRKTTEESSFFSYIKLSEEKFVKKKKQISNILMIVFWILYLIVGLSGMLYSLPINESVLEQARIVGISVLSIMMIGQIICNFILAFSDIKQLDEKMQKQKKDLSDMDEEINLFITVVCVAGCVLALFYKKNLGTVRLITYSTALIMVGVEAVYNSFISLYVKVRRWYHVEEIIIRIKTPQKVYKNVFNYRKRSDMYEFVCKEDNVLKRMSVPVDEIESIEKKIDKGKTYLDVMREKEVNSVKKENKAKEFWYDFANQNKAIVVVGFIAVIYCLVWVCFKSNPTLNVSEKIYPWGEFIYNVAVSVIAAVIFFIVQVYIPNRKKEQTLKKYAKRYIKEVLLVECNMLKIRTELIREGKHSEDEIKEAINSSCVKIKTALNESLNNYLQVLSEELIDDMNGMLFDDMLYMISIRANGSLANKSLEKILQDQESYNLLWKRVDKIKSEVEKI